MVHTNFPVQQWEEHTDAEGNVTLIPVTEIIRDENGDPVMDEKGNPKRKPVLNPEAVAARDPTQKPTRNRTRRRERSSSS